MPPATPTPTRARFRGLFMVKVYARGWKVIGDQLKFVFVLLGV
jgi:hypothetical protein